MPPGDPNTSTRARPSTRTALLLAALAFAVYNANLRGITSHDTYPTRLLPISVLTELDLDLDEFTFLTRPEFLASGRSSAGDLPYFIEERRGHWMSTYPVMPALLALPVYAVPVLLGLHQGAPLAENLTRVEVIATFLSKIAGSLAAALSVALVYLTLLRFVSPRGALGLALVYAFATSTWSVTSQGLWQMSMSQPLLAATLHALVRARESSPDRWFTAAGATLALSVACRPPMAIFAMVIAIYVLRSHPRRFARFAAAPALIGGALLWYNLYYFGALAGGYAGPMGRSHSLAPSAMWEGLRGLLVSPNRGILVFSPVLVPAFAGGALALARRGGARDGLFLAVTVGVALSIAQYAAFSVWHGDFNFSYRFLTELLPAFVLLMAPTWSWCTATRARRVAFTVAATYSVFVQIVGAFFYPCGWFRGSEREPMSIARMFDWRDMELVQCVRSGPVDPDGPRAIRRALGR